MTNYRYITGVHIESVGDPTGEAGGYIFYHGQHTPPSGSYAIDTLGTKAYDWVQALRPMPDKVDSIDPFTGKLTGGAMTLKVDGSDAMAKIFQRTETIPVSSLTSDITSSATDIPLGDSTLGGDVVWIGDEAIKLGGTYSAGSYTGSTRGYFGSEATGHDSGLNAYAWLPKWEARLITFVRYNLDTDAVTVIGKAYIKEIRSDSAETISITTEDQISALLNAEGNRTPNDLARTGGITQSSDRLVYGSRLRDLDGSYIKSRVLPEAFGSGTERGIAIQVNDALVYAFETKDGDDRWIGLNSRTPERVRLGSRLELDEAEDGELSSRPFPDAVWEVLAIDREGDENTSQGEYISATRRLAANDRYHPVAFDLTVLKSVGRVNSSFFYQSLGEDFALGLEYLDTAAFETVIDDTPELREAIDHLVWGWDGSRVRLGEKLRQLLRTWGFFHTKTSEGKLSIDRLKVLDIAAYTDALANAVQPLKGTWGWKPPAASQVNSFIATIGELPWRAGSAVSVTSQGTSRRTKLLSDTQNEYRVEAISREKALGVAQQLSNIALIGHYGLPRITVRVPSEEHAGTSYDLGAWISFKNVPLENRVLIDRNGEVVNGADVEGRVDLIGLIVSRKLNMHNFTAELDVLLMAYRTGTFARERAPAMFISGTAGSGTRLYCLASSQYGNDTSDNETFTVGDEVRLGWIDGSAIGSTVRSVTAIGSDGTGDYIDINLAFASTPTVGVNYVRLAYSDEYSNDTRYSSTVRPYAFFATSGSLTTTTGTEDPDPYGGFLGVTGASGPETGSTIAAQGFIRMFDEMITDSGGGSPLDCHVDNILRHNESELWKNADAISFTPISGNSKNNASSSGIRPVATLRRATYLQVPWEVQGGLESVRVRFFVEIDDTEGDSQDVELTIGLRGLGEKSVKFAPNAGNDAGEELVEWTLDRPLETPVVTDFFIDVRSEAGSGLLYQSATDADGQGTRLKVASDATMYPAGTYTVQASNDPSLQFTRLGDTDTSENDFDHLISLNAGEMYVRPAVPGGAISDGIDPELWPLSYVCIRGVSIEFKYSGSSGLYRKLSPRAYRANVTVGAAESGQHVDNILGVHSRPRALYVGPRGTLGPEESWPSGYGQRFTRVFDSTGSTAEILVDQAAIRPTSKNPTIRLSVNELIYHYVRTYAAGGGDLPATSRATWRMRLYVDEFDTSTGAWSNIATEVEDQKVEHFLTDQSGRWTALLQERLRVRDFRDGGGGDSYVYKEGLLYPEDRELITRRTLEVPITWDPDTDYGMLRFRFTLELGDGSTEPGYDPVANVDWGDGSEGFHLAKWLVRMTTGLTVWEVPQ